MTFPRLRIRATGPTGRDTRIWLDDNELTHGLTELELRIDQNGVNECALTIIVGEIDIDAETLVQLQAIFDAQEQTS